MVGPSPGSSRATGSVPIARPLEDPWILDRQPSGLLQCPERDDDMTKRDYILAAELIHRATKNEAKRQELFEFCVELFAADNPRFDAARFRDAVFEGLVKARPTAKPRKMGW